MYQYICYVCNELLMKHVTHIYNLYVYVRMYACMKVCMYLRVVKILQITDDLNAWLTMVII